MKKSIINIEDHELSADANVHFFGPQNRQCREMTIIAAEPYRKEAGRIAVTERRVEKGRRANAMSLSGCPGA